MRANSGEAPSPLPRSVPDASSARRKDSSMVTNSNKRKRENNKTKKKKENSKAETKKDDGKTKTKRKSRNELKIRALPAVGAIYDAIPADGIGIQKLAEKFPRDIDDTNVHSFHQLVMAIATVETDGMVKPRLELPSKEVIANIIGEAQKLLPPIVATENAKRVASRLLNPEVTFDNPSELVRDISRVRPQALYRTFYEGSTTPCAWVSGYNQVTHREMPNFALHPDNGFQSISPFKLARDLTPHRIERHLRWAQKRDPSSFISAFKSLDHAISRASWHYQKSQRIGQRSSIAAIDSSKLVAASVRATLEETFKTTEDEKDDDGNETGTKKETLMDTTRDVEIPIWVDRCVVPEDRSPISPEQLSSSNTDVWMSVNELRVANLKLRGFPGNNYEWLAWGKISRSNVLKIMPYDGETLHETDPEGPIRSKDSVIPYIFDKITREWRLEEESDREATSDSTASNKRKAVLDA